METLCSPMIQSKTCTIGVVGSPLANTQTDNASSVHFENSYNLLDICSAVYCIKGEGVMIQTPYHILHKSGSRNGILAEAKVVSRLEKETFVLSCSIERSMRQKLPLSVQT